MCACELAYVCMYSMTRARLCVLTELSFNFDIRRGGERLLQQILCTFGCEADESEGLWSFGSRTFLSDRSLSVQKPEGSVHTAQRGDKAKVSLRL